MRFIFNALLLFVLIVPCLAQVKPSMHLATGQTYYLVSNGTSSMMQSVNGSENKVNLALSFRMAFKVTGVKDTIYNMQASYEALEMKIHTADTTISIDSKKNDKPDTASALIAGMIGKPFGITLTAGGRVHSVENLDQLLNGVFDKYPELARAKKELIKNQFMRSFGENAFKGSIETGTAILQGSSVTKNYKWTINNTLTSPAKVNVTTVYQLVDITPDFYQVHGEGLMATDTTAKSAEINGMPVKYQLQGSTLIDVKIDKKTGWIIELDQKQLIEGTIEIQDNRKLPGRKMIPVLFNTEITTTGK
jgi:hypothetical protein